MTHKSRRIEALSVSVRIYFLLVISPKLSRAQSGDDAAYFSVLMGRISGSDVLNIKSCTIVASAIPCNQKQNIVFCLYTNLLYECIIFIRCRAFKSRPHFDHLVANRRNYT